jgi:hypothetical protein
VDPGDDAGEVVLCLPIRYISSVSRRIAGQSWSDQLSENAQGPVNTKPGLKGTIHYSVSAEAQVTDEHKLTGREILELAGFTPADDYRLTRDSGGKEIGLNEEVPIHDGEAFTAIYRGITPTS